MLVAASRNLAYLGLPAAMSKSMSTVYLHRQSWNSPWQPGYLPSQASTLHAVTAVKDVLVPYMTTRLFCSLHKQSTTWAPST